MKIYENAIARISFFWKHQISKKEFIFRLFKVSLLLLLIAGTYTGFLFFKRSQDCEAVIVYCELVERYQGAVNRNSKVALSEISADCDKAMSKYWLSSFKPYFNLCKSCSLALSENKTEAIAELQKTINSLPKHSEFYRISLISLGLLMINQKDNEKLIEQGKKILHDVSESPRDSFSDIAIFYNGLYEFKRGNKQAAGKIWHDLLFNPLYSESPFREITKKALNWEI
jgi:hypothetical protein